MNEFELRSRVVEASREASFLKLNSGTSGNISVRCGTGMLITPTGIPDHELTVGMIVPCGLDGSHSSQWLPSSEWAMHARIYAAFERAQAIVHAHPDQCVAFSCLRKPLPAFHYMIASFGGEDVRCSRYETFGSPALAAAAVEALRERNACLLANHGMICFADDLAKALANAVKLETLARQYWLARSVGDPVLLSEDEMMEVKARYGSYGQQSAKLAREAREKP